MPLEQLLAFAIVIGTMALFVWGRLRYDLAVTSLPTVVAQLSRKADKRAND